MNFEGSGKLCKPARVGYSVTIWVIANVVHYKRNTGRIIESQLPFCQVFFVFVIPFREPVHMFIFVCTYIYICDVYMNYIYILKCFQNRHMSRLICCQATFALFVLIIPVFYLLSMAFLCPLIDMAWVSLGDSGYCVGLKGFVI